MRDAVDPNDARRSAQHILSDRRYHSSPAPRPLRGPVQWVGDRFSGIARWIGHVFGHVPGIIWLLIAIAIVTAVIARIVVVARRRRVSVEGHRARRAPLADDESEDPDTLERAADEAERDGDLDRAVRLRFRAGLLRLGDRGAITYRPSVTTTEVRRALGSQTFDELARTFEEITYGGRTAHTPDIESARREWPRVLDEARRR